MQQQMAIPSLEADRLAAVRGALAARIARWTEGSSRLVTAIPALSLSRREAPGEPTSCLQEPSVALIVQGTKRVLLGGDTYAYDPDRFLITSVDLPATFQVIEASREKPYLSLLLRLDQRAMAELMADSHVPPPRGRPAGRGMVLGEATLPLLNAFLRLIELLDAPNDIPVLAPLVQREIFYRLLVSDQGARLRQMALTGSQSQRIAQAIDWLKSHYAQPLRIDELAASVQMSTSTFHHHFRALTAMSPLQFQKWLRLNEARRLMLAGHLDAATAAFQVGYESPSQFSREYSRLFGAPPLRDIANLRRMAGTA